MFAYTVGTRVYGLCVFGRTSRIMHYLPLGIMESHLVLYIMSEDFAEVFCLCHSFGRHIVIAWQPQGRE